MGQTPALKEDLDLEAGHANVTWDVWGLKGPLGQQHRAPASWEEQDGGDSDS